MFGEPKGTDDGARGSNGDGSWGIRRVSPSMREGWAMELGSKSIKKEKLSHHDIENE